MGSHVAHEEDFVAAQAERIAAHDFVNHCMALLHEAQRALFEPRQVRFVGPHALHARVVKAAKHRLARDTRRQRLLCEAQHIEAIRRVRFGRALDLQRQRVVRLGQRERRVNISLRAAATLVKGQERSFGSGATHIPWSTR